jgi:hypothetical protein
MPNSKNKIYMVFASKFVGTLAVLLMEKWIISMILNQLIWQLRKRTGKMLIIADDFGNTSIYLSHVSSNVFQKILCCRFNMDSNAFPRLNASVICCPLSQK